MSELFNEFKQTDCVALILIDGPHKGIFGIVNSFDGKQYQIHPMQNQENNGWRHYYSPDEVIIFKRVNNE